MLCTKGKSSVNGQAIQSPYVSHPFEPLNYNFHSSLQHFNYAGKSGGGDIVKGKGQVVKLEWDFSYLGNDGGVSFGTTAACRT